MQRILSAFVCFSLRVFLLCVAFSHLQGGMQHRRVVHWWCMPIDMLQRGLCCRCRVGMWPSSHRNRIAGRHTTAAWLVGNASCTACASHRLLLPF